MHTIQLQLDDNLYEDITRNGIDIKEKFKEFLMDFVDDGYPAISTQEAKKRVKHAVEAYRDGSMQTVTHHDIWDDIDKHIKNKIENRI